MKKCGGTQGSCNVVKDMKHYIPPYLYKKKKRAKGYLLNENF